MNSLRRRALSINTCGGREGGLTLTDSSLSVEFVETKECPSTTWFRGQ